jgi:hypothetical protein
VFVPIFVGRPLGTPVEWERLAALGPEHRDALDALEEGLVRDATDDGQWNAEAWARVDQCLTTLGL